MVFCNRLKSIRLKSIRLKSKTDLYTAMLMQAGTPYESDEGRAICGTLSAILTGRSYASSALLAAEHGAFEGFDENR
ncbi:MAG: hypothetical protein OPY03_05835, partial [Nitrosopumilus sp.]|nr:hypothetical protein [Nitrosopumilus sp.]